MEHEDAAVDSQLAVSLGAYFTAERVARAHFTDRDFAQISHLLKQENRVSWSSVPRLYTVLRHIEQLMALETFLQHGLTDMWFPFTIAQLPDTMLEHHKKNFIETQHIVVTKGFGFENSRVTEHLHFKKGDELPFILGKTLGKGGYGRVREAHSLSTGRAYALKTFRRSKAKRDVESFLTESQVLRRIKHHHCVELVMSYTDPKNHGLLMSPVADCNLATFFDLFTGDAVHKQRLQRFFGCLAHGLSYLHRIKIRHRDIKPANILVKGSEVYLADFGVSLDWENLSRSTTTADAAKTWMYCAPEVADYRARNSGSDIWSLGCVFLEMLAVLQGLTVQQLQDEMKVRSGRPRYYENADFAIARIEKLGENGNEQYQEVVKWVRAMLATDPKSRVSAEFLFLTIIKYQEAIGSNAKMINFCGDCCSDGMESSSESESEAYSDTDELDVGLDSASKANSTIIFASSSLSMSLENESKHAEDGLQLREDDATMSTNFVQTKDKRYPAKYESQNTVIKKATDAAHSTQTNEFRPENVIINAYPKAHSEHLTVNEIPEIVMMPQEQVESEQYSRNIDASQPNFRKMKVHLTSSYEQNGTPEVQLQHSKVNEIPESITRPREQPKAEQPSEPYQAPSRENVIQEIPELEDMIGMNVDGRTVRQDLIREVKDRHTPWGFLRIRTMPRLVIDDWESPVKLLEAFRLNGHFMMELKYQSYPHYELILKPTLRPLVPLLILYLRNEYCWLQKNRERENATNFASAELGMVMRGSWRGLKVQKDILKLLIGAAGALLPDTSRRSSQGALLDAIASGHIAVVEAVVKIDTGLMSSSSFYCMAIKTASQRGRSMIVEDLIGARAKFHTLKYPSQWHFEEPAAEASKCGHISVIKVLLRYGLDIDAGSGKDRWRMIHHATNNGHTKLVKYLLSKGANPTIGPLLRLENTPLNLAKGSGNADLVEILEKAVIKWKKNHPEEKGDQTFSKRFLSAIRKRSNGLGI
ncbi:hypothetical protein IQ07DRAFT_552578 [Pyrenochaeta sp. DS3sAY3a]|nr:hypothetical protein IQ07DRAFT_552578 [Pyrenochaeta sp. DS3sAY3a]